MESRLLRVELNYILMFLSEEKGMGGGWFWSIVHTLEDSKCLGVCYGLSKGRYCRVQQTMNEVI